MPSLADCASDIAGLEERLKTLAGKRNMKDETVGPVITWTTEAMLSHVDKLLKIPGTHSESSVGTDRTVGSHGLLQLCWVMWHGTQESRYML